MTPEEILRDAWGLVGTVEPLGGGLINDSYLVKSAKQKVGTCGEANKATVASNDPAAEGSHATGKGASARKCAMPFGQGIEAGVCAVGKGAKPSKARDSAGAQLVNKTGAVGKGAKPSNVQPWKGEKTLVLQRVNSWVFRDANVLMENVSRVTAHLRAKRHAWAPSLIPTTNGESHAFESGKLWRLWTYLPGASAIREVETDSQAQTVGTGFGKTYRWLQDLPGPRLKDVIPGFLQLDHYLADFDRSSGAPRQLASAIDQRRYLAVRFRSRTGYIHGDCRVEHLVLNHAGEAAGVIDLDTVMWGNWAWEFGDLVRSMGGENPVPSRFEAAARGYLAEARIAATAQDLVLAPRYTTFMLGVRFLTDHLNGDRYFKISTPGENLERAHAQFRLLGAMEAMESELLRRAHAVLQAASFPYYRDSPV